MTRDGREDEGGAPVWLATAGGSGATGVIGGLNGSAWSEGAGVGGK